MNINVSNLLSEKNSISLEYSPDSDNVIGGKKNTSSLKSSNKSKKILAEVSSGEKNDIYPIYAQTEVNTNGEKKKLSLNKDKKENNFYFVKNFINNNNLNTLKSSLNSQVNESNVGNNYI